MNNFSINIQIQNQYQDKSLHDLLHLVASTTLSKFFNATQNISLDIIIANNKILHDLNMEFMGENSTTDVLAFPTKYSKSEQLYSMNSKINFLNKNINQVSIGEVYISYPQAKKQSKLHCHTLDEEITILIVHGILHILGFDHRTIKENFEMIHATKFILNQISKKG